MGDRLYVPQLFSFQSHHLDAEHSTDIFTNSHLPSPSKPVASDSQIPSLTANEATP